MGLDFDKIKKNLETKAQKVSVDVPEWGGPVLLRRLNAVAGIKISDSYRALPKNKEGQLERDEDRVEFYTVLLANSIVDEAGNPIFLDVERREIIRDLSFVSLNKLGNAALKLNDLLEEDEQPKKTGKASQKDGSPST